METHFVAVKQSKVHGRNWKAACIRPHLQIKQTFRRTHFTNYTNTCLFRPTCANHIWSTVQMWSVSALILFVKRKAYKRFCLVNISYELAKKTNKGRSVIVCLCGRVRESARWFKLLWGIMLLQCHFSNRVTASTLYVKVAVQSAFFSNTHQSKVLDICCGFERLCIHLYLSLPSLQWIKCRRAVFNPFNTWFKAVSGSVKE